MYLYRFVAPNANVIAIPANVDNEKNKKDIYLFSNYPNPCNPSTNISFSLPGKRKVTITIYDIFGRQIKKLLDAEMSEGINNITWNTDDDKGYKVTGGIYICKLSTDKFSAYNKLIIVR